MAYIEKVSSTTTSITVKLSDLAYPAYKYPQIYITCTTTGQKSYNLAMGSNKYSASYTFSDLSCGSSYSFRCDVVFPGGQSYTFYATFSTNDCPPPPPGGVGTIRTGTITHNSIQIYWNSATNADYYAIEYKPSSSSSWMGVTYNYTGTSYTVTGLSNYTSYDFKVYARNSSGNGTPSYLYGIRTKDGIPPTVSITNYDGNGRIYFAWSASDDGSGIRNSNPYYVEITNANGTTYGNGTYTSNTYYSFLTDGEGKQFVNGAKYYVRVYAYDNANNISRFASVQITYVQARPPNWEWHTPKISGNTFSLTANEWNSFCTKINQFRQYKNKSTYNFTTATSGGDFYAYMFNEARNAINEMSPPTSVPSIKYSGDIIYANDLNRLRDSLNSIQ